MERLYVVSLELCSPHFYNETSRSVSKQFIVTKKDWVEILESSVDKIADADKDSMVLYLDSMQWKLESYCEERPKFNPATQDFVGKVKNCDCYRDTSEMGEEGDCEICDDCDCEEGEDNLEGGITYKGYTAIIRFRINQTLVFEKTIKCLGNRSTEFDFLKFEQYIKSMLKEPKKYHTKKVL